MNSTEQAKHKKVRLPIFLQQQAIICLTEKLQQANRVLATDYPLPTLSYQQRGTRAGAAWLQRWEIALNPVLLLENGVTFIQQVVPHELAHLLVYRQFGQVAPHGKEWRWMMEQVLSIDAKRTHNFGTHSVQGKCFLYRCHCQQHQLTIRRHNQVVRGQREYLCRQCGGKLQLVEAG